MDINTGGSHNSGSRGSGNDINKQIDQYLGELMSGLKSGEFKSCPICLEDMDEMVLTKCSFPHIFCLECCKKIQKIRQAELKFPCPICRQLLFHGETYQFERGTNFQISEEVETKMSSKLENVVKKGLELMNKNQKTVIFTNFVKMIDMIKYNLEKMSGRQGIVETLLSAHSPAQRQEQIFKFMNRPGVYFLICSIKVGGVGLNLTNATNVILVEPVNSRGGWEKKMREICLDFPLPTLYHLPGVFFL